MSFLLQFWLFVKSNPLTVKHVKKCISICFLVYFCIIKLTIFLVTIIGNRGGGAVSKSVRLACGMLGVFLPFCFILQNTTTYVQLVVTITHYYRWFVMIRIYYHRNSVSLNIILALQNTFQEWFTPLLTYDIEFAVRRISYWF